MILAFMSPQAEDTIRQKIASGVRGVTGPGAKLLQRASAAIRSFVVPPNATVFTDDHAPVEGMTRRMITEYYAKLHAARK